MAAKTFSLQTLALSVLATALISGIAHELVKGRQAEVDRARMSEQIRENADDIGDLTALVRKVASSHEEFLVRVATLTARLDAFLDTQKRNGNGG